MTVTDMLGLDELRMMTIAETHWAGWVAGDSRLASVENPARLCEWRRAADPEIVNDVLLGLAQLAAFDGADDPDAALVLAWLLLPAALRVRHELRSLSDRVDEVVAAQLWVEVRSLPWRRQHRVAAKVAARLREGVLLDCGVATVNRPSRLHVVHVDVELADPSFSAEEDPATALAELLAWACANEVISVADRELLVGLITTAHALNDAGVKTKGTLGLASNELSDALAADLGVSSRTVRRRTARCVQALTEASSDFHALMAG